MYESEYQRSQRLQNVLSRYGEEYYNKLIEIENSNIDQLCKNYIIENTDSFLSSIREFSIQFESSESEDPIQKHVNQVVSKWNRKFPYN